MQFSEKQLQYINADVDDATQHIYRQQLNNVTYGISCKLPKGHYNMVFKSKQDAKNVHSKLALKGLWSRRYENIIAFNLEHADHLAFMVSAGGGSKNIVISLREQAITNMHKLEEENNFTI